MTSVASSSSTLSTAVAVALALIGLALIIVVPIRRHTSRPKRRRPILADGALCRRLRQAGHDYHPADDPKTRAAFAATRARLVDQMQREGQR